MLEDVGFLYFDSVGRSRGLLVLWKNSSVSSMFNFKGDGFLGVKVRWTNHFYYIVNVYSP